MRDPKRQEALPIGRTARLAYEIDVLRGACCRAANTLASNKNFDADELEECAQLDEALYQAQRLLKSTVRSVMLTRLNRRSRTK